MKFHQSLGVQVHLQMEHWAPTSRQARSVFFYQMQKKKSANNFRREINIIHQSRVSYFGFGTKYLLVLVASCFETNW